MLKNSLPVVGSLYSTTGQRKYLTAPERDRFIAAAKAHPRAEVRTLCLTLIETGCRISEALSLHAASIELDEGTIALRSLKKRSVTMIVREVPVSPDLVRDLGSIHRLTDRPRQSRLWNWSRSRAWQLVKEVMRQAGISMGVHATPKGLRHSFGLHAVRSGVPLNLIQRWLGHARLETTAIYLQAVGIEERELAARMWSSPNTDTGPQTSWRCSQCAHVFSGSIKPVPSHHR